MDKIKVDGCCQEFFFSSSCPKVHLMKLDTLSLSRLVVISSYLKEAFWPIVY
jgi:hypothetical protein